VYITTKTVKHNDTIYPVGADIDSLSETDAKRLLELGAIKKKTVVQTKTTKAPVAPAVPLLDTITPDTVLTEELLDKLKVTDLKTLAERRGVEVEGLTKKADIITAILTPPVE